MLGYHVTTPKKWKKYEQTGAILPPVRFWGTKELAQAWAKRTGRNLLVTFERPARSYPLPMKKPAYWSPDDLPFDTLTLEEL